MFGNANDKYLTWLKNGANTATASWLPSIVYTNQYYNKNSLNLDVVPPCFQPGVTNLFAIVGHFVSYRWVSGPHNFVVILWNLLKRKKLFINRSKSKKFQDCWSHLNASRAARNSVVGRMFVTSALNNARVFVPHTKNSTLAFVRNTDTEHQVFLLNKIPCYSSQPTCFRAIYACRFRYMHI